MQYQTLTNLIEESELHQLTFSFLDILFWLVLVYIHPLVGGLQFGQQLKITRCFSSLLSKICSLSKSIPLFLFIPLSLPLSTFKNVLQESLQHLITSENRSFFAKEAFDELKFPDLSINNNNNSIISTNNSKVESSHTILHLNIF